MKKKIWIFNHYSTTELLDKSGRHYWMGKYLIKQGFEVKIFAASTLHNSSYEIEVGDSGYSERIIDGISCVFVKTPKYYGNGFKRLKNMMAFYKGLFRTTKLLLRTERTPDIILASSVHPLTCVAGIKISKRNNIPCICEIRDLWPESIVVYMNKSKSNPIIRFMYDMEKWIYVHADSIIFTFPGGYEYIQDRRWDDIIDKNKIYYINNAVDIVQFEKNVKTNVMNNQYLQDDNMFKVTYCGSIRTANEIMSLVECAKVLKDENILFLIFGDGDDRARIEDYCNKMKLSNVYFGGKVDRKYIPYILRNSDLNVLNYKKDGLWKYGSSQNKLFEYLAAGKPIISNIDIGYDIIKEYNCGISKRYRNEVEYSEAILTIRQMDTLEYNNICENAKEAARNFDCKLLGEKAMEAIERTMYLQGENCEK